MSRFRRSGPPRGRTRVAAPCVHFGVAVAVALGITACSETHASLRSAGSPDAGAPAWTDSGLPDAVARSDGGTSDAGSTSAEDAAFDPAHVLEVAITLETSDWDAIRTQARSQNIFMGDCLAGPFTSPFTFVPATVSVDGVTLTNVGVRKKGFLGSLDDEKPSLKISADQYVSQSFSGGKDLTLNNALQDPGLVSQCLGYAAFASAGVPAPRCNFARVTVNGKDLGVYVHVEAIKKPFLRRHFASDAGNLYEGTLSDFREGWLGTFEAKSGGSDASRADLEAVAAAAAAPDSELLPRLEAVIDLPEFLSFWAVEVLVEHRDGYSRNANNYFAYRDPTTGRVALLPWGADQLFGMSDGKQKEPAPFFTVGTLARRLYAHPEGRSRFEARLREILGTIWQPDAVLREVDRMERLLTPLLSSASLAGFTPALAALRARIPERRDTLEAQLAGPPAPVAAPRPPVCFRDVGTVSGTFDTTWGTIGASDPFAVGVGTLNVVVNGAPWAMTPGYVAALAGPSDDPTSDVEASVVVPGLRADGMLALMYFGLDFARVVPGDVSPDISTAPGLLLLADPAVSGDPGSVVGMIRGGTLHFDEASTIEGDPVKGAFQGTLTETSLLDGI